MRMEEVWLIGLLAVTAPLQVPARSTVPEPPKAVTPV